MQQSNLFTSWTNVVSAGRNEVVFERRNKEYGAFIIRRDYNKTVLWAMFFSFTGIFLAFGIPYFLFETPSIISVTKSLIDDGNTTYTITINPPKPTTTIKDPPVQTKNVISKSNTTNNNYTIVDHVDVEHNNTDLTAINASNTSTQGEDTEVNNSNSNVNTNNSTMPSADEVPIPYGANLELYPEFPGGMKAFYVFLQQTLIYPPDAKDAQIEGRVYISFVIDKFGKPINFKVEKGVKGMPSLEKEALRALQNMPLWTPARQGNMPVSVALTLPVSFKISH